MLKITLGLAVAFLLYVGLIQDRTIIHQRQTILEMTQNPACLVAPFPVTPKPALKPLIPNPLVPREQ
jgi:hypothetical protein